MSRHIVTNDLRVLTNEKNDICVSIIVPTHRLSPERRTDPAQLEKAIQQAKSILQDKYDQAAIGSLIQSIDELYQQIDFMRNSAGIGIFVSHNVKWLIHFFFPVKERVTIGKSFDIRDVLYESYYAFPYIVLMLDQKEARLFNARLNEVTEITDSHFPKKNDDEYEYTRPSRGSSYAGYSNLKEFEKDKSISEEIRLKNFLHKTDELLKSFLDREIPLIITGENKDLAYFSEVSKHVQNIAGTIPGNYMTFNEHELGTLTWKAMKPYHDNRKLNLVRDFNEKIGEGLGLTGIENIWKAVQEGRGYKLLVEKDFSVMGYTGNNDDYEIHLHPPKQPHRLVPDVVNRLISAVLEKNGEVIIMENDVLQDFGRMALITRY